MHTFQFSPNIWSEFDWFQGEDGFPGFKGDMGLKGDTVSNKHV